MVRSLCPLSGNRRVGDGGLGYTADIGHDDPRLRGLSPQSSVRVKGYFAHTELTGAGGVCHVCEHELGQVGVVESFRANQRSRAARASHEYTTAVLANRSCQAYRRRFVRIPRNPRPKKMILSGRVRVRVTA